MKKNYFVLSLIFLTFFVISFLTNIIGPLIPDIIKSFNLSLTTAALLPFAFFIAYGIMSIPSGILLEKYGERKSMMGAFLLSFLGALFIGIWPNYYSYLGSLFLIGAGMAMLQVAINPLLRVVGGDKEFAFNSVLGQFFFGFASFVSPLVYSYLVLNMAKGNTENNAIINLLKAIVPENLQWMSIYWIFAIISLLMVVVIAMVKIPKVELQSDEKIAGGLETNLELIKKPVVILYFLGLFSYVGLEQGVANFMSQFLETYHNMDPQTQGAESVSLFWGLLTVGTVFGLILLKFVASKKVLVIFTSAAIISLIIGLVGTATMAFYAFPMVGFFSSVMYSIIISLALNSVDKNHGAFSGILISGICGGAIIPLIVGWIGDYTSLQFGMCFLFVNLIYILSIGFWAKPLVENDTISL